MPKVKLFDQQEILEKAMELFWKKGYHATSMQELVNHLGISRSSIYDTFGGKKQLFELTFQRYRATNLKGTTNFLQNQKNVKTGFRLLFEMGIKESINDADNKGCFVINTTSELLPDDEAMQKVLKKNKTAFENVFYKFLLRGEQSGEIPKGKDLKAIASLLFTLYNGIKLIAKVQPNRKKLLAIVDTALLVLD